MILFVFEGVKREPDLFRTIQRLYFSNRKEQIVCSYNNNIYQLLQGFAGVRWRWRYRVFTDGKVCLSKRQSSKRHR